MELKSKTASFDGTRVLWNSGRYRQRLISGALHSGLVMVMGLLALASTHPGLAQEYIFTKLAGPDGGAGAVDGTGTGARLHTPMGVAAGQSGNLYVADSYNHTIRMITPEGVATTLAGLAETPGSADGSGSAARFNFPFGVAADGAGNVYVTDQANNTVRKITPDGVVTTLAGLPGSTGSRDGTGIGARFSGPAGVAADSTGAVYLSDSYNHTIRKISPDGMVITLAGKAGQSGSADGSGTGARFNYPGGLALDRAGNVYVADTLNHVIRKIAPDGVVSTLVGLAGATGSNDGTGAAARFNFPLGVAVDSNGNLYVADNGNHTIREVTPDGAVTTLAGDPTLLDQNGQPSGAYADGTGHMARFNLPAALAVDSAGRVSVADSGNHMIRLVTPGGAVTTLAGRATASGGDDGAGAAARFNYPTGVAADQGGNLFVADGNNQTIRKVTPGGVVETLVGATGSIGSADGTGSAAQFGFPRKVALDNGGNLYVADTGNATIRLVTPDRVVTTLAGTAGNIGRANGTGSEAAFDNPTGLAVDPAGNLYVADTLNHIIRKVTPAGLVTTFAGMPGTSGSSNGAGSAARFNSPFAVGLDPATNLYVADTLNHTIRKVTPAGAVTTLAGAAGLPGSADGVGQAARFYAPYGLAVDSAGNIWVADTYNNTIRKVTPAGVVTTPGGLAQLDLGGNPIGGSADGLGNAARFNSPRGIAIDTAGNIYVADSFNNSIRFGTTRTCPDQPTADLTSGPVGEMRQLETRPQTAVAWRWEVIRRPAHSVATFSNPTVRNPIFTPDVADLYVFQLQAVDAAGAVCIRTLALTATTLAAPSIVRSSLALASGQLQFSTQSLPGHALEVQTTTVLGAAWKTISTLTNLTGTVSFTVPATNSQQGFFRVRQL